MNDMESRGWGGAEWAAAGGYADLMRAVCTWCSIICRARSNLFAAASCARSPSPPRRAQLPDIPTVGGFVPGYEGASGCDRKGLQANRGAAVLHERPILS